MIVCLSYESVDWVVQDNLSGCQDNFWLDNAIIEIYKESETRNIDNCFFHKIAVKDFSVPK